MNMTEEKPVDFSQELTKANITEQMVIRMREQAKDLLSQPINDKTVRSMVDTFRKQVWRTGLAGQKLFEVERKARHAAWQEVIAKEREVLAPFYEIQKQAEARIFEFDYQEEQKAKAIEEARVAEIQARSTALQELGYMLKDHVWTLDGLSVDAEEVLKADTDKWSNLFNSLRLHGEEVAQARIDALAKQEAEAARVARETEALAAREKELAEREAKVRESINRERVGQLLALGCVLTMDGRIGVSYANEYLWSNDSDKLHLLHEDAFQDALMEAGVAVEQRNEMARDEEAAKNRAVLVSQRKTRLLGSGWVVGSADDNVLLNIEGHEVGVTSYISMAQIAEAPEHQIETWVTRGQTELARRKELADAEVAKRAVEAERERVAREEQDAREAEEKRIAMMGDEELVKMASGAVELVVNRIAGTVSKTTTETGRTMLLGAVYDLREVIKNLNNFNK